MAGQHVAGGSIEDLKRDRGSEAHGEPPRESCRAWSASAMVEPSPPSVALGGSPVMSARSG